MDINTAKADFLTRLAAKPSWAGLINTEFVDAIAAHMGWGLISILDRCDRIEQEYFVSTAINSSSILAQADFRNYTPRRKRPSFGTMSISNFNAAAVRISKGSELTSSDNGLRYRATDSVTVASGATAIVGIEQVFTEQITTTISKKMPFTEIVVSGRSWDTVTSFRVFVDNGGPDGYVEWPQARLFRNVGPGDKAWDEYHGWDNTYGVRFGNGDTPNNSGAGMIPEAGWSVLISLEITSGPVELTSGRQMNFASPQTDDNGSVARLECRTASVISGGADSEGIAEIKSNLRYWSIYDDQAVFKSDYEFFLRRQYPTLIWVQAWGAAQEESVSGTRSIEAINAIFVSGYFTVDPLTGYPSVDSLGVPTAKSALVAAINSVLPIQCHTIWRDPVVKWFSVTVNGTIAQGLPLATAVAMIEDSILADWGAQSLTRTDDVSPDKLYRSVDKTKLFVGQQESYTVAINPIPAAPTTTPISKSTISIGGGSTTQWDIARTTYTGDSNRWRYTYTGVGIDPKVTGVNPKYAVGSISIVGGGFSYVNAGSLALALPAIITSNLNSTMWNITNTSGNTFRYTWSGSGTVPDQYLGNLVAGAVVNIMATNSTFNAANIGSFTITASNRTTNANPLLASIWFEVTNSAGVQESGVRSGTITINPSGNGYFEVINSSGVAEKAYTGTGAVSYQMTADPVDDTVTLDASSWDAILTQRNGYYVSSLRFTTTGTLPAGILANTDYFAVKKTSNIYQLFIPGSLTPVNITSSGTGVLTANQRIIARPLSSVTTINLSNNTLSLSGPIWSMSLFNQSSDPFGTFVPVLLTSSQASTDALPALPMSASATKMRGDTSTIYDISHTGGSTYRYTNSGGTAAGITADNVPVGSFVYVNGGNFTNNTTNNNMGLFSVTASGANYFEVNNPLGVAETGRTTGSTGLILFPDEINYLCYAVNVAGDNWQLYVPGSSTPIPIVTAGHGTITASEQEAPMPIRSAMQEIIATNRSLITVNLKYAT